MLVKGEQIRAIREERGHTLQEMARRTNLSLSYLSEIERGSKRPSLKTIEKLSSALNIPKRQIVAEETPEAELTLGEKVKMMRTEKGYSLQDLAEKTDISPSYLSEIERGNVYPAIKTIHRIADELEVPSSTLIGGEGSLGQKLRALREELGLTQAHLANLAGVTPGLVGQIEQGKVQPSLKTLEKIADVMGVSPCHFILEPCSVEQVVSLMNPELRDLLMHPNVKSVLDLICNLNEKELQFVLNFIRLFKQSDLN